MPRQRHYQRRSSRRLKTRHELDRHYFDQIAPHLSLKPKQFHAAQAIEQTTPPDHQPRPD